MCQRRATIKFMGEDLFALPEEKAGLGALQ